MSAAVKVPWFYVPAATPPAECRSCKAEVYWITTATGKKMPVDCDVEGGYSPDAARVDEGLVPEGRGVSHFARCPQADTWRSR